jgi:hypothetical protein
LSAFFLTTTADLQTACAKAMAAQAPQLPLLQAAAAGDIGLMMISGPATPWPAALIERVGNRPLCILIGGDPGHGESDPAPQEWACARRLRYWAGAALVHGAKGEHEHYRAALLATVLNRRLALIETTSARARDWQAFLKCPRTLLITPPDGVQHPAPPRMLQ